MNTKFSYLYQDGSGHRYFAERIFAGTPAAELVDRLREAMEHAEEAGTFRFIAEQVGLPSVFPWVSDLPGTEPVQFRPSEDSLWHEVNLGEGETVGPGLLLSDDEPTDGRSLEQFVRSVERAKAEGWNADENREIAADGNAGPMSSVEEIREPDVSE